MALVEYIPAWRRGSHEAAGNVGIYPHNGARRVLMEEEECL